MRQFIAAFIISICFIYLAFYFIGIALAEEVHYNTKHLDCGTLHGTGTMGIWFKDEYYLIPIVCE